jgi:hypothetical protein
MGDLRAAAFTFPSTFQIIPRLREPLRTSTTWDRTADAMALDSACLVDATGRGVQLTVDPRSIVFWRSAAGRALIGKAWDQVGDGSLDEFLARLEKVLAVANGFRLDLKVRNVEAITYFYSSDYPTTQRILLPNTADRNRAIYLSGLGDGRVLLSSILERPEEASMPMIKVTESHGDLPKSRELQEQLKGLLADVADVLLAERAISDSNVRGSSPPWPGPTDPLANEQLLKDLRRLVGRSRVFEAAARNPPRGQKEDR